MTPGVRELPLEFHPSTRSERRAADIDHGLMSIKESVRVSVVVPVINEESCLRECLESARSAGAFEIIVVDGGSSDATKQIATSLGCTVLETEPGRALQQNAGAEKASGDVLLFLHADTVLPKSGVESIRKAIEQGARWGAFRQSINDPSWVYRWIESGNSWRVRRLGVAYGDQGLFFERRFFFELGRFDEEPFLEDYLISRRARKLACPFLLEGPLGVSARRWKKMGPLRQTALNWSILMRYQLGWSPSALAKRYRRHDRS